MSVVERKGRAALPSVDRVLREAGALIERHGRALVTEAVREALAERRAGGEPAPMEAILADCGGALARLARKSQRRVFNLTGTVLHTNLGRAPLPEEAIEAAAEAMREPTTLEYETDGGKRGERDDHVAGWLKRLTGAEAALAVNNNAGALVLALNALAAGKETIVSRGELIEIGGAFRLPDIMARAGTTLARGRHHQPHPSARLRRRDRPADRAHPQGPHQQLRDRGLHRGGADPTNSPSWRTSTSCRWSRILAAAPWSISNDWGLPHEPTVSEALKAGADLVTFSGDKLLGGPQAGLIVGRADLIATLARNPLKRALRLDKIRLAALEAVLRLYADPDRLAERLPALRLLTRPRDEIAALARAPAAGSIGGARRHRLGRVRRDQRARSAAALYRCRCCRAPGWH